MLLVDRRIPFFPCTVPTTIQQTNAFICLDGAGGILNSTFVQKSIQNFLPKINRESEEPREIINKNNDILVLTNTTATNVVGTTTKNIIMSPAPNMKQAMSHEYDCLVNTTKHFIKHPHIQHVYLFVYTCTYKNSMSYILCMIPFVHIILPLLIGFGK